MKLSTDMKKLMILNTTSLIVFNYINLFVNLYIWEEKGKIFDLAWFGMFQFLAWSIFYVIGVKVFSKTSLRFVMRISSIFAILSFLLLSYLEINHYLTWIAVIGVVFGAMYGFYYAGQTQSVSILGKRGEYTHFFSIMNVISQIIAIGIPIIFSLFIKGFGYEHSFILMIFFSLIMYFSTYFLPNVQLTEQKDEKEIFQHLSFSEVFSGKGLKLMFIAMITGGIFLQFQTIFVMVYTFSLSEDRLMIALINVAFTVITLLTIKIVTKTKEKVSENSWMNMGVTFIIVGYGLAIYFESFWLFIGSIFITIGLFLFRNIYHGQQYNFIQELHSVHKIKYLMWREIALCWSRSVMLFFILFVDEINGILFIFLCTLAILAAFSIPYLHQKAIQFKENN